MKSAREVYKMTEIGEIPSNWDVKKLGDVVDVISGATPKTNINEYWDNGDVYWATPTDITSNGKYIYKTEKSITEIGLKNCSAKLLPIGSILMSSRATIGERCINNVPMATNQGFKSLVCRSGINNEFIYYYVDILKEKLIALASGSTFLEVSKKVVEDIKIVIPSLYEQEKIASILSTVDEQIDNIDALIEKNKELKKGLMQTLLTKGIGHTKFKKTEIGEIPEEWEVVSLSEITDVRDGTHDSPKYLESGIPFITSKNLKNNKIDFSEVNFISIEDHKKFSQRSNIENGDILFGMIGTIGSPVIVKKEFEFSIKNVALIKFNKGLLNNVYIVNVLKSSVIEKQFSKLSNGGVQKFIALSMIRELKIPLPKIEEQGKIASILSEADKKIEEYKDKKQKIEELKKGLMQQLLTGKIRVV